MCNVEILLGDYYHLSECVFERGSFLIKGGIFTTSYSGPSMHTTQNISEH